MNTNHTLSYKVKIAINKSLASLPSYFLPKMWNSITLEEKKQQAQRHLLNQ